MSQFFFLSVRTYFYILPTLHQRLSLLSLHFVQNVHGCPAGKAPKKGARAAKPPYSACVSHSYPQQGNPMIKSPNRGIWLLARIFGQMSAFLAQCPLFDFGKFNSGVLSQNEPSLKMPHCMTMLSELATANHPGGIKNECSFPSSLSSRYVFRPQPSPPCTGTKRGVPRLFCPRKWLIYTKWLWLEKIPNLAISVLDISFSAIGSVSSSEWSHLFECRLIQMCKWSDFKQARTRKPQNSFLIWCFKWYYG